MKESTVVRLPSPEGVEDALTAILRRGARDLIRHAVEAELAAHLALYEDHLLPVGRRRLVRHVSGSARHRMPGCDPFPRPTTQQQDQEADSTGLVGRCCRRQDWRSGRDRRNLLRARSRALILWQARVQPLRESEATGALRSGLRCLSVSAFRARSLRRSLPCHPPPAGGASPNHRPAPDQATVTGSAAAPAAGAGDAGALDRHTRRARIARSSSSV